MLDNKAGSDVTLIAESVDVAQKFTRLGGVQCFGVAGSAVRRVGDVHRLPEC